MPRQYYVIIYIGKDSIKVWIKNKNKKEWVFVYV